MTIVFSSLITAEVVVSLECLVAIWGKGRGDEGRHDGISDGEGVRMHEKNRIYRQSVKGNAISAIIHPT